MKLGVVGKPNVGKSTFFKALTLAPVEIANYPFVTIKPNKGFGHVSLECPETKFKLKCQPKHGFCIRGVRFVPVELIDVAGLVPGAHQGKGLGNEFLDDLREADALIHVVDVSGSTNEKGEPIPAKSYDPASDIIFLENELDMWIFGILKRGWERFARKVQQEHLELVQALLKQLSGLKITVEVIKSSLEEVGALKIPITEWDDELLKKIATKLRESSKPMIIAANKLDVPGAVDNLNALKQRFPKKLIIGCSAECELALKEAALHSIIQYLPGSSEFELKAAERLTEKQSKALGFIKDFLTKFKSTGVQEVLNTLVFELLGYIAVFPVANSKLQDKDGNVLPDCYLVHKDTIALEFAAIVHSDFAKNFIKAKNILNGKIIGKEHKLNHGDVIEIITS